MIRSPLLRNLLKAIFEFRQQIFLAVVLFFTVKYIFALVAFGYYYYYFPDYDCTMFKCFIIVFDQTF